MVQVRYRINYNGELYHTPPQPEEQLGAMMDALRQMGNALLENQFPFWEVEDATGQIHFFYSESMKRAFITIEKIPS